MSMYLAPNRYIPWYYRQVYRNVFIAMAIVSFGAGTILLLRYIQNEGTAIPPLKSAFSVLKHSPSAAPVTVSAHTPELIFPSLNLTIPVSPVGLTKGGDMAVPALASEAGWYKFGPSPGQSGNAVIDGHNNVKDVGLGVFGTLYKLKINDSFSYKSNGRVYNFVVAKMTQYPASQLPSAQIFGATTGTHLNLITCAGPWNRVTQAYPDRLVIYTDLKD